MIKLRQRVFVFYLPMVEVSRAQTVFFEGSAAIKFNIQIMELVN